MGAPDVHLTSLLRDALRRAEDASHSLARARRDMAALEARELRARERLELARRLLSRLRRDLDGEADTESR